MAVGGMGEGGECCLLDLSAQLHSSMPAVKLVRRGASKASLRWQFWGTSKPVSVLDLHLGVFRLIY